ncbi:MAG: leucine-rich repeat protein [Candidatus Methanomethylophilaceae archaeon]|nr:leucine-rich repeat protein [Candidatus Methanomethylophilaceae archaeon]
MDSIDLPDSIESLGEWAFANAEIPSLEVPSKIKHIPKRAFGSGYILSLRFRGAPISIGEEAFCTCRARY